MMVYEILLAVFGVIGLAACVRFVWGLMIYPIHSALILIPAQGDGQDLEHQLRGLQFLCDEGKLEGETILLADCGLTEEGRQAAMMLTRKYPGIGLCTLEREQERGRCASNGS